MQIKLYRHPDCAKCARISRVHRAFDWADRLELSTETPPTGPLRMGEVVVEDLSTSRITRGAEAFAMLCRCIPAYAPLRLLLKSAAFRRFIDRQLSGCNGESCAAPTRRDGESAATR